MKTLLPMLIAALLLAASCGGGASNEPTDQPTLTVEMSDYKVVADRTEVPAGRVVFAIRNRSAMVHELKILKTDAAPDQLPYDQGSAKAKEDGKVGGLENIAGGVSRKLILDLAPGKYVLVCNVAGHYMLGMRSAIEVK